MTIRIGWLSPLSPASGIGTFSRAIARHFPASWNGDRIDFTLLYPDHATLRDPPRRSIRIEDTESFRNVLGLFDLLVYNIGNNAEHHETIFRLLGSHPGIVICHDYVYQHYLADRSIRGGQNFASFAALLMKFGGVETAAYLDRSRITSRLGRIRYAPWDSDISAAQPMSECLLGLGSALVVHSRYAEHRAAKCFDGPILKLGMPCDQKARSEADALPAWSLLVETKPTFTAVSFGHIQQTKCIHLAIEAIAASDLLRKRLKYVISGYVGDHDYLQCLQDFVRTERLEDVVRFETDVSDRRLGELMHDADLFINLRSPNTEGSSASLVEQLDSGRPVLVLESGCYAEVPDGAAIKLPERAGSGAIGLALEQLIADPKRMAAIGLAGRSYARGCTCASYGERLVAFILEQRDLLRRRGACVGIGDSAHDLDEPLDAAWIARLAQARAAMRYLDCNILVVDPELVLRLEADELCTYVAHVVFGIFDDARLRRALMRFFVWRTGSAAYWACVRFALVVDAVVAMKDDARERLKALDACYETDYWDVLEALAFDQYVEVAFLTFLGRMPTTGEFAKAAEGRDDEVFAKRRALLDILQLAAGGDQAQPLKLATWLDQSPGQAQAAELPCVERDLNCLVGSAAFREHADLSGFHPQEADHAWTRGPRGYIGMRFGAAVRKVEVVIRAVNATPAQPATIGLSSGTTVAEIEVCDGAAHLVALDIPQQLTRADGSVWLQLSTSHAGTPVDHPCDKRILGVCLMALKISVDAPAASLLTAPLPQ